MWFGVPMGCVPRTSEQQLVAARVEERSARRVLDVGGLGPAPMADAISWMEGDVGVRGRLIELARAVQSPGGPRGAADVADVAGQTVVTRGPWVGA